MKALLKLIILSSLVFTFSQCQKREDKTIQRNLLTFVVGCTGGSLSACQANCATTYPDVTGENYPNVSTCNSNCSNYCSLTNLYLLISNK
ncbi:MAG: hypothetical protein SH817_15145 [Leptospira sp.]|nr:hypothetical protein [Leptospira sp.]